MGSVKTWFAAAAALFAAAVSAAPEGGWLSALDNKQADQSAAGPQVSVELVAEKTGLEPQANNRLAVVINHEPGWHTYWRMPGDAGLPTRFNFTAPAELKLTEPRFPLPEALITQGMVSYGYSDQAVFPFEVEVPRFPTGRNADIRVHVEFLACKDMCIPGEADASIRLPYTVAPKPSENAALIENALPLIPEAADIDGLTAVYESDRLHIKLPATSVKVEKSLQFFPLAEDTTVLSAEPIFRHADDNSAELFLTLQPDFAANPRETIDGLLVADGGPAKGGWAVETVMPLRAGSVAEIKPLIKLETPAAALSFSTLTALAFAFLGGLILNLMPCVFPILSLKLLQLVEGYRRGEKLFAHGVAFTGGVLLTMGVLSGLLLALRGVGMALGWGFQLQSAWVVALLVILFVAITLNLCGVFEFTAASHLADTRVARNAPKTGVMSSFFTGVLAVVVASPCTAPFMGAALGYAVTQPAIEALAVFLSLGFGMALPWLLLCLFPAWSKWLPKPGVWMDWFRKIMAIPMGLAVIWLVWVLSKQITINGLLLMAAACGATAVFLWLLGREQWGRGRNRPLMAVMAVITIGVIGVTASGQFDRPNAVETKGNWAPWSEAAVKASLAEGKPVFIDFTAAWCVTCQANKFAALNRNEVQARFKAKQYTLLVGDWTNRDPAITEVLAAFGRSGVPLYLIYRPDGSVEVLPELLTPGIVTDAIDKTP